MKAKRILGVFAVAMVLGVFLWLWLTTSYPAEPSRAPIMPALREVGGDAICKTWTSRDVPKAIPDNDDVTGIVSQLPVAQTGFVSAITVTFTISHEYPGDLRINLCPPGKNSCTLVWGDLTSTGGEYTVAFSSHPTHDENDIYDAPPYTGSYPSYYDDSQVPPLFSSLSDLVGTRTAGIWQLAVKDEGGGDVGSLTAWNLELCATDGKTPTPVPATITPTPTWTPLYGCANTVFLANKNEINAADTCYCDRAGFSLAPLSDSGSPDEGVDDWRQMQICQTNCQYQGGAFTSANYDVYLEAAGCTGPLVPYEDAAIAEANIQFATPYPYETRTITEYYDGLYTYYLHEVVTDYDGYINGNSNFTIRSLWDRHLDVYPECPQGYVNWSYELTNLKCNWATPVPTSTPRATYTPVCATPTPRNFGWWWQW